MAVFPQDAVVKTCRWLCALAALSFLTTLGLPYIGEEGVYTNSAIEMWSSRDFFHTTLYGTGYPRPPLLNWLIIPLANLLGWQHMLAASRIVTACATVATALLIAWLVTRLTRHRGFALFSALVFLTSDALFYRGWLAYADSLFSFFSFAALACLWLATHERRSGYLWVAAIAATCAFLTKLQTVYLYYAIAWVVLAASRENRKFLLGWRAIAPHLFGAALFYAWNAHFAPDAHAGGTAADIAGKFATANLRDYLNQLWSFPIETVFRFAPASLLAMVFLWRRRGGIPPAEKIALPFRPLVWMTVLNYLPYWLGPKTGIRYVMPVYPLAAILIAYLLWQAGEVRLRLALRWLAAAVALKYVIGLWAFPAYQHKFRGDYAAVAGQIMETTQGLPLYVTDVSATGLSTVAEINSRRYPQPPLHWPPEKWDSGFVLSYTENPALGEVSRKYQLGGNELYLLCRGAACGGAE